MHKIALGGNPNSGKTSVFNALTGSHQHVGNWPGVTVERKEGELKIDSEKFVLIDLPGTYSLSANSIDEKIARDFIIEKKPELTVIVIDQTNIERNFYLVLEIIEMGRPVLLVLNMDDEAKKMGIKVEVDGLEKFLNVSVCKTVASKRVGIDALKEKILLAVQGQNKPKVLRFSEKTEKIIQEIEPFFKNHDQNLRRWFAIKALEKDAFLQELMD